MLSKQFEYPKFVYKRVREIKFVKKKKGGHYDIIYNSSNRRSCYFFYGNFRQR